MAREADPAPHGHDSAADTEAHLWRRQLLLVALTALVLVVAVGLLMLTLGLTANREARAVRSHPDGWRAQAGISVLSWEMWPALLAVGAVAAVLSLTVAHAVRVALFAFRKGDEL